jgi:hypothetical protein
MSKGTRHNEWRRLHGDIQNWRQTNGHLVEPNTTSHSTDTHHDSQSVAQEKEALAQEQDHHNSNSDGPNSSHQDSDSRPGVDVFLEENQSCRASTAESDGHER